MPGRHRRSTAAKTLRIVGITGLIVGGTTLGLAPAPASADGRWMPDSYPCGKQYIKRIENVNYSVQNCDDWTPDPRKLIPVYNRKAQNATVVGYIYQPGPDWYLYQELGASYTLNGYRHNWWAMTMADNGNWGWVSEVYFKGGSNNVRDGCLYVLPDQSIPVYECPIGSPARPFRS
jgi:hypothetical protein